MTLFHAVLLGIIEGLTEFIPVSSTAHMLIAQKFLNLPANDTTFTFLIVIQAGPLVSLIVYYWKDLWEILSDTVAHLGALNQFEALPSNAKLGWYVIAATIPALLAGYLLKDVIEKLFDNPLHQASIRLFTAAALLFLAERIGNHTRKLNEMNILDAVVIGAFQVFALFPGASRSGSAISGGLLRGLDRPAATHFAFLMSTPVILAAVGYELISKINDFRNFAGALPLLIVGVLTAGIFGWLAIKWLINYLSHHSLYVFAGYCALLGTISAILIFVL